MDEPPVRAIGSVARYVSEVSREQSADAVEEHERRLHCHSVPPPDRSPLTAIPYANYVVTDEQLSHAIEMLPEDDECAVAFRLEIPLPALQRALADYHRRYGGFLFRRATTG